jgi:surface polysaccharide O-acyltransferase-like enzyme
MGKTYNGKPDAEKAPVLANCGRPKSNEKLKKKFNCGLELLRLLMCFAVVATHFWDYHTFYPNNDAPWYLQFVKVMRPYAVPVFMLMTFYLSSEKIIAADGAWLGRRFRRLLVPFVGWTFLTFALFKALTPLSPKFACTFRDLWLQMLLGTTKALGSQMWFQAVLIILTAFFAVFFRVIRPKVVFSALVLTFLMAVAIEYSGLNFWLFKDGIYEVRNPLGRVFPMLSYACVGLLLGMQKPRFAQLPQASRRWWAIIGFCVTAFVINFPVFVVPDGFYYRGLNMLVIAVALMMSFALQPFGTLPNWAEKALLVFSRHSMGIYLVHMLVGRVLTVFLYPHIGLQPQCFSGTFLVFFASWLLCFALARILPEPLKPLVV